MRERSKNAARCRREKENAEFADLARLLPLPLTVTTQLDKASVIRLTSAYLKMRQLFPKGLGGEWGQISSSYSDGMLKEMSSHLLQSLDGFVFVLAADAKIIYISETASVHLGLSQVELTGNSIYDFIHSSDYEEMKSLLNYKESVSAQKFLNEDMEVARSFCLRMKCILAKRNAGLASDGYKVIHCRGYLKLRKSLYTLSDDSTSTTFRNQVVGLVAFGHSVPSTAVTEIEMSNYTFMFRAGLDMTLIYLDSRVLSLTGYEPHHLMDKTLYKFIHPADCLKLRQDHATLLMKGQVITSYYRLLTRTGGWIWIQSLCTVVHNNRASRQHCILALNHILSERIKEDILLDNEQMQEPKSSHCNSNSSVASAKRSRLSSKTAKNSTSQMKMERLFSDSGCIQQHSVEAGFKGISSNASVSEVLRTGPKDPQLQLALVEFDQILKSYPSVYDYNQNLFQTNIHSPSHNAIPELKIKDSLYTNDTLALSVPEVDINSVSQCYHPTSIYGKYPIASKDSITPETPLMVNAASNPLSLNYIYSQEINSSEIASRGNSSCIQLDGKLPYYDERISNNPLNSVQSSNKCGTISNSDKNYLMNNGDFFLPNSTLEMDTTEVIKSSKDSTYETMSSGIYLRKSDSENTEYIADHLKSSQLVPTREQNLDISGASGFHSSPSDNVYFNTINAFVPVSNCPLVHNDYQTPVLSYDKNAQIISTENKDIFGTNSPVTNEINAVGTGLTASSQFLDVPKLQPNSNLVPLSLYCEINTKDSENEQKRLSRYSTSECSNAFCNYTSQYTSSSPGTPDSCETDYRTNIHNTNEKNGSLQFQSSAYVPYRTFYALL